MSRVAVQPEGGLHRRISSAWPRLAGRFGPIQYLILSGGLLIIAIGIGTALAAMHYRDRAIQSTERQLENSVLLVTRHFDEKFGDLQGVQNDVVDYILGRRTTSDDYRKTMASLETHLKFRAKLNPLPYVGPLNLFDSDGWLINSSDVWPPPRVSVADRAYFRTFTSGTDPATTILEPVVSRVTGAWTAIFARKLVGANGEFIGTLSRGVEPSHFESFFASLALGPDATISMIHRDGTVLARYPRDESLIGQNLSSVPAFQALLRRDGSSTGRYVSTLDNTERL